MNNRKYQDTFEALCFGSQVVWTTRFYIQGNFSKAPKKLLEGHEVDTPSQGGGVFDASVGSTLFDQIPFDSMKASSFKDS